MGIGSGEGWDKLCYFFVINPFLQQNEARELLLQIHFSDHHFEHLKYIQYIFVIRPNLDNLLLSPLILSNIQGEVNEIK